MRWRMKCARLSKTHDSGTKHFPSKEDRRTYSKSKGSRRRKTEKEVSGDRIVIWDGIFTTIRRQMDSEMRYGRQGSPVFRQKKPKKATGVQHGSDINDKEKSMWQAPDGYEQYRITEENIVLKIFAKMGRVACLRGDC
ncbi:hypothetical protein B9Z55_003429 [Caenorhabditis nigoni]|nr:hypothetical protein B9Z55_003429 [Caenorhabditis nigoni]